MLPDISAAEIADRIAEARNRISASVTTNAPQRIEAHLYSPTVKRRYDESYSRGDVDWLPQRAEMEIAPPEDVDAAKFSESRELIVTLSSGPEAIYRYFPFAAYIYIDHELSAIAQFNGEWQTQDLRVVVPAYRKCILTVITEISDFRPLLGLTEDERQVALILCGLSFGGPTDPRRLNPSKSLAPIDDHFSQSRTPLAREAAAPVFVIGAYRSATSILTWAIGQHPNLWPLEETGWLHLLGLGAVASHRLASAAKRSFFDVYDISSQEFFAHVGCSIDHLLRATSLRHFDRINLQRLSRQADIGFDHFDERFQLARSLFDTKRRWVDGTPENAENILLLKTLFPLARFVCTLRHPFDVVASMAHFERAGGESMSIDAAADMWLRKVEAYTLAARALGPRTVQVIDYNQVVQHPAEILQDIFDFIGEPRFPNAAQTFQTRINSSRVNASELQCVREEVLRSPKADALLTVYEAAIALAREPWEPDPQAFVNLQERQNDIINRIVSQVS